MTSDSTHSPARFYGFARTRILAENLTALKTVGADSSPISGPIGDAQIVETAAAAAPSAIAEVTPPPSNSQRSSRTKSHVKSGSRQGTASAVPKSGRNSGVLTPEVGETVARDTHDSASSQRSRKKSRSKRKASRARRRTAKAAPEPPKRLSRLELHQAHCGICGNELQEEIDERFVNWECVSQIADDYELDRSALYRHAHATGLFPRRDRNIRRALSHIIHEADRVQVTADSVVRAVKIFAHINARGEWVNPPTHVVFSSTTSRPPRPASVDAELSGTPSHLISGLKP